MVFVVRHAERSASMPVTLPASVKKLLEDKAYGHVVTFDAQGGNSRCQCATFSLGFSAKMRHSLRESGAWSGGVLR
jgi:hypothetical protein